MIELTKTTHEDLETLFEFQTNKDGIWMAAFMPEDPMDKEFYMNKWTIIVANPEINMQTIRLQNKIIGSVAHFEINGETNISYWLDQPYWGKGLTTLALKMFVNQAVKRPLFARVAFDNYGSQRVLEKCGFKTIGKDKGFANARNREIEEFICKLI